MSDLSLLPTSHLRQYVITSGLPKMSQSYHTRLEIINLRVPANFPVGILGLLIQNLVYTILEIQNPSTESSLKILGIQLSFRQFEYILPPNYDW